MKIFDDILGTIGNTPLVKINKIAADIPATVLGKVETFNPGHSIKDRMALKMVDDAINGGKIKPGGTFIECTSGNTGMGLALAAVVKGYKCIFTTSDKQSKEKIDILKAFGAEVIVCPTNVEATDPRSYYSVARRLSEEIPNSYWFNQYDNLSNAQGHYESTGPEIWEQTEGKITHLIATVGTGGTISGTGKYLKEKNPNIQILGVDVFGSVLKKYHETREFDEKEIYPYITEGVGEDILPANVDFDVIDFFAKVNDKDGAVMARRLAREEGLLLGYSAGTVMCGLLQMKDRFKKGDVVVVIFHDHGSRYVGKIFNDEWMRERGFLDKEPEIKSLIESRGKSPLVSVNQEKSIVDAIALMKKFDISQIPVKDDEDKWVGSITEHHVIEHIGTPLEKLEQIKIKEVMGDPFPALDFDEKCSHLNRYLSKKVPAVLCKDPVGVWHIITNYDLIKYTL